MKIYNSIYTCKVFNYFLGVIKHNDLRYLIKLDSYHDLPEPSKDTFTYSQLNEAWEKINEEFEEDTLDLDLLRLNYEAWESYWDFKINPEKEQVYNKKFAKYRAEFDTVNNEFVITDKTIALLYKDFTIDDDIEEVKYNALEYLIKQRGVVYQTTNEIIKEIREKIGYYESLESQLYLIDHIECSSKNKQNITSELLNIGRVLNLNYMLDPLELTIAQLMQLRKQANEKIEYERNNKKENNTRR